MTRIPTILKETWHYIDKSGTLIPSCVSQQKYHIENFYYFSANNCMYKALFYSYWTIQYPWRHRKVWKKNRAKWPTNPPRLSGKDMSSWAHFGRGCQTPTQQLALLAENRPPTRTKGFDNGPNQPWLPSPHPQSSLQVRCAALQKWQLISRGTVSSLHCISVSTWPVL